jgi:hypothetical protein
MFCVPVLVFGDTEGVWARFHVLRSWNRFWRCGGRSLLFNVLRSRPHFRRFRGRRVQFSCFALPDSFSAIPRALGPVFMFCVPVLLFGDIEGVGSRFHVVRSQTRFWRCGGRRLLFSCFALPDSISAVTWASAPRFHVLCARTRFRQYRGRRVTFSSFARPNSFSAVPTASALVYMLCTPGLVIDDAEGVGYHFYVLRSQTRFRRFHGRRVPFSCFSSPYSF